MPPRSIVVNPSTPSNTLSFALPPGVTIDVESVLAAIDASAAGDTTATLTIADSSGAVIARKRQTEVVSAGTNPGSATWALRLADDNAAVAATSVIYDYIVPVGTTQVSIDTNVDGPMAGLLPQTFTALAVFFSGRTDGAVHQTFANVTFNNDNGTNYDVIGIQSAGGAVVPINQTSNHRQQFPMPGGLARAQLAGAARFTLPNYAYAAGVFGLKKAGEGDGGFQDVTAANSMYWTVAFGWRPTPPAAIDRIKVGAGSGNWIEGTRLTIVAN